MTVFDQPIYLGLVIVIVLTVIYTSHPFVVGLGVIIVHAECRVNHASHYRNSASTVRRINAMSDVNVRLARYSPSIASLRGRMTCKYVVSQSLV